MVKMECDTEKLKIEDETRVLREVLGESKYKACLKVSKIDANIHRMFFEYSLKRNGYPAEKTMKLIDKILDLQIEKIKIFKEVGLL